MALLLVSNRSFIVKGQQSGVDNGIGWSTSGNGRNNSSGGGGSRNSRSSGPSAAQIAEQQEEAARQQKIATAHEQNQQGLDAWNKGDWATAASCFEQALKNSPDDSVIRQNLANASQKLKEQQANKLAAAKMQQIVENFSKTITAAPSVGGLDFDNGRGNAVADTKSGGLEFTTSDSAANPKPMVATANPQTKPTLEFGDPMVVDARVPSGLPKSLDDTINRVFRDATPDAVLRIRKGWLAVMNKDWKVADACFKDALNHDPQNPEVIQFVKFFDTAMHNPPTSAPPPKAAEKTRPEGTLVLPKSSDMEFMSTLPATTPAEPHRLPDEMENDFQNEWKQYFGTTPPSR
jgi:tetratricopeptide (TPR) repeat protein